MLHQHSHHSLPKYVATESPTGIRVFKENLELHIFLVANILRNISIDIKVAPNEQAMNVRMICCHACWK